MAIDFSKVTQVVEEVLWKEIIHAAKRVEFNHGLTFTIERSNNKVEVFWAIDETEDDTDEYLVIEIREIEPKQPALLVP